MLAKHRAQAFFDNSGLGQNACGMENGDRHRTSNSAGTASAKLTFKTSFRPHSQTFKSKDDIIMHPLRKLRETGAPTPAQVAVILAENVVMHSPVLIKPIIGRELVAFAISNASQSRDNPGKYVYEGKLDDRTTLLRWQGMVEGHIIESLELLTDDESGLLLERTIAYRPFPALKIFRDRLIALNAGRFPANMWEYPAPA